MIKPVFIHINGWTKSPKLEPQSSSLALKMQQTYCFTKEEVKKKVKDR